MNRFKELRKQHHFTQQDVSNALKGQQGIYISPDSLEKYESGEENPKIDELEALATFYGTSVAYLRGLDMVKLSDRKEHLKQAFISEARKSSTFYVKVTYVKEKIARISIIYKFGYDKKIFTVQCLSNDEDMFAIRNVRLGKKINLNAKETIELASLLQDAGHLIDILNKIDKGDEDEH